MCILPGGRNKILIFSDANIGWLSLLLVHNNQTVCFCGISYVMFLITSLENNKNGKHLVCASPYVMFTRPPVYQYEVEDVNKFLMDE